MTTCHTQLEQRILKLSTWLIHNAYHLRKAGAFDVRVGGHQASYPRQWPWS
jgi:pyruvate dehydrogenase complex dehydrogenase (E1) component